MMELSILILIFVVSFRLSFQNDIIQCPTGSTNVNGACQIKFCPSSHVLVNEMCQPRVAPTVSPCVVNNCQDKEILLNGMCVPKTQSLYCPNGGSLHNGMCYYNSLPGQLPCQQNSCGATNCITPAPPSSPSPPSPPPPSPSLLQPSPPSPPSPPTSPPPPPSPIEMPCPTNSVLIDGSCRRIYCPRGTVHNGRCLEPICTDGLVWTGRTCQKPEVITTILEIENNFISDVNQTGPVLNPPNVQSKTVYHTIQVNETSEEVITSCPPTSTNKCCTFYTPRICKKFSADRWSCFHRSYKRCDEACGSHTVIYLKVPHVQEQDSMLIMPPNPSLEPCPDEDCGTGESVDCSGCSQKIRESCSSYCFFYRCYTKRCRFMDQSEYCTKYPGDFGCKSKDGCFNEEWCSSGDS